MYGIYEAYGAGGGSDARVGDGGGCVAGGVSGGAGPAVRCSKTPESLPPIGFAVALNDTRRGARR